jgi:hypothetical protein
MPIVPMEPEAIQVALLTPRVDNGPVPTAGPSCGRLRPPARVHATRYQGHGKR